MKSGVPTPSARRDALGPERCQRAVDIPSKPSKDRPPRRICGLGVTNTFVHSAASVSGAFFVGVADTGDSPAMATPAVRDGEAGNGQRTPAALSDHLSPGSMCPTVSV